MVSNQSISSPFPPPDMIYHGTVAFHLSKILEKGLIVDPPIRNWRVSQRGIYLTSSLSQAHIWALEAKLFLRAKKIYLKPEDAELVIIGVETSVLEPGYLQLDEFDLEMQQRLGCWFYRYCKNINPKQLKIVKRIKE